MHGNRMSETELRVVCRECGSEVSSYVTECPYCGSRVRKRAPKLQHHHDHFEAKPSARSRLRMRLPRIKLGSVGDAAPGFRAPGAVAIGSAILLIAGVAANLGLASMGAIAGPIGGEWWRALSAPFAYDNVGYLLAVGLALAIFGSGVEQRLGTVPALIFLVGCGSLGALGGYGVAVALDAGGPLIAGGNSIALGTVLAWVILRRAEARGGVADPPDLIGAGVAIIVLLLLPLVESSADVFAGVIGGGVGALLALIAAGSQRH